MSFFPELPLLYTGHVQCVLVRLKTGHFLYLHVLSYMFLYRMTEAGSVYGADTLSRFEDAIEHNDEINELVSLEELPRENESFTTQVRFIISSRIYRFIISSQFPT